MFLFHLFQCVGEVLMATQFLEYNRSCSVGESLAENSIVYDFEIQHQWR